jgi:hypothetical protein
MRNALKLLLLHILLSIPFLDRFYDNLGREGDCASIESGYIPGDYVISKARPDGWYEDKLIELEVAVEPSYAGTNLSQVLILKHTSYKKLRLTLWLASDEFYIWRICS